LFKDSVKQLKRFSRVEGENNLPNAPELWLSGGAALPAEAQADVSVVRVSSPLSSMAPPVADEGIGDVAGSTARP
jgi:hypothetical protein